MIVPMSFIQVDKQMQNHIINAPKSKLISQNETEFTLLTVNSQDEGCIKSGDDSKKDDRDKEDEPTLKKVPGKLMTPFKNTNSHKNLGAEKMQSIKTQIQDRLSRTREQQKVQLDLGHMPLMFKISD